MVGGFWSPGEVGGRWRSPGWCSGAGAPILGSAVVVDPRDTQDCCHHGCTLPCLLSLQTLREAESRTWCLGLAKCFSDTRVCAQQPDESSHGAETAQVSISWWLHTQSGVCVPWGVIHSGPTRVAARASLEYAAPGERSQTHKATHYLIPFR